MKLLVLGGTAPLGHATAVHARDAGHDVTCAARGSAPEPDGCAFVRIDRDADDGLASLAAERWDAVIDVSRSPRHVARAVRDLRTEHWVFVSTANVYALSGRAEPDERAPTLEPVADLDDIADYGRAKVACENLVRDATASATVVRAGLIGGDGDTTARSGYYPGRFAHPTGDDVLVPGDPDFPVALIDVHDLARWLVDAAEGRFDGTFNATGETISLRDVIGLAASVALSPVPPRWVDPARLAEAGVTAWGGAKSLPLWIDDPEWRWFSTLDCRRARAAGLRLRPLRDTLADALRYETSRRAGGADDQYGAGLTDADERGVRAALDGAVGDAVGDADTL